jgi:hypothetical protein
MIISLNYVHITTSFYLLPLLDFTRKISFTDKETFYTHENKFSIKIQTATSYYWLAGFPSISSRLRASTTHYHMIHAVWWRQRPKLMLTIERTPIVFFK